MNVNVLCTRSSCKTAFVTSFDSFVSEDKVRCPKCDESWAVHMTAPDGTLIHPTQVCPACFAPAGLDTCRCQFYCRKCLNGHDLHTCPVHKKTVTGNGHDAKVDQTGCSCEVENP
jgi:hypothetical protein